MYHCNRQSLLILLILLTISGSVFSCELKVGWEDWRPYIYKENGQIVGPEYRLIKQIAEKAQCNVVFIETPWARALKELKTGQLDLLYGASFTKERSEYAYFSNPYRYETFKLVVKAKVKQPPISFEDWLVENKQLVTISEFYYGQSIDNLLHKHSHQINRLQVRHDDQLLGMLLLDRIEAYLIEEVVGLNHIKAANGALQLVELVDSKPEPMHLMLSKTLDPSMLERVNLALNGIVN